MLLVFAVLGSYGLIATRDAGAVGRDTVVVFPPWSDLHDRYAAVAQTGAPIVGPGPVDWMIVTRPSDAKHAKALQSSRGFLLLNAAFARLCGVGGVS